MNERLLDRRRFNALGATLGLTLPTISAMTLIQSPLLTAARATPRTAGPTVKLPDGTVVPAIGQGSWHLGQGRHPAAAEEEALHMGISLGMTLIDTSEGYGGGRSEELIGHVIAGEHDRVFLVSKVDHATDIARACEASLRRLATDHLDLYLLHWPIRDADLSAIVAAFEGLRAMGKIRAWGVSNFNVSDMEGLFRVPDGHQCATNQVRYSLNRRGIERDLLPWCERHSMPVMAYSPLGGDNNLLVSDPTLVRIGKTHDCTAAAAALAWAIRSGNVIAIPESGSPAHVKENAVALSLKLTPQDLEALDAAYPGPSSAN
jgi:diketogulonate reductase-like aldo/keto reductase